MNGITLKGKGNVDDVINGIIVCVLQNGVSAKLIANMQTEVNGVVIALLVFEKYYIRIKSKISLSVVISSFQDDIKVFIASSGGNSPFYEGNLGAGDNFAFAPEEYLYSLNFEFVEPVDIDANEEDDSID